MTFLDATKQTNMLRITTADNSAFAVHLIVEGRLTGLWVNRIAGRRAVRRFTGQPVTALNLAAVHFADAEGLDLLHELLGARRYLQKLHLFIQELLNK